MSKADKLFVSMCEDIIANGFSSEGQKVRPHWPDGTPAHTIKNFGVVNRYNLQEEFPALGSGRRSLTEFLTSEATSGMSGQVRMELSARRTDISSELSISSSRARWTRLITSYGCLSMINTPEESWLTCITLLI